MPLKTGAGFLGSSDPVATRAGSSTMVSSAAHAQRVLAYVAELREGNVLNDRYRIEQQIGAGGMGAVYAARHAELGTKFAIKVLLPELLSDPASVARFAREAKAAATIANQHVVRILDVGQLATSGAPYIVMEFLDGLDGEAYRTQHGPLAIDQILDVALQACSAVAAAHALGIIHRDLKPANLFFVGRPGDPPLVKVLDFGLSKVVAGDSKESGLTKTGTVFGSPAYASPEQWRDAKHVDARSDIWALGVILYELLTGELPFVGASLGIIGMNVHGKAPSAPSELREDVPADLERVVLRCLEKDPADRFQDVSALAEALRGCRRRRFAPALGRWLTPSSRTTKRWPARSGAATRRLAATGAPVLLALMVAVATGAYLHQRRPTSLRPRAAPPSPAPDPRPMARELDPAPPSFPTASSPSSPAPASAPSQPQPASAPIAPPRAAAAVRQRRVDAGASAGAAGCDPPYYYDAQGIRRFKVECL